MNGLPKTVWILTLILIADLILAGCSGPDRRASAPVAPTTRASPTAQPFVSPPPTAAPIPTETAGIIPSQLPDLRQEILEQAGVIVQALKDKDLSKVARYVHPDQWLRFSPYAYIKETDLVFPPAQVAGLMEDATIYQWGDQAASGMAIRMSFADYLARYVYDLDFAAAPLVGFDEMFDKGSMINNLEQFYTRSHVVEYHFPEVDPQYGGMDYRSLRLVFQEKGGRWYLVGIVHDEWTP